MTVTVITAEFRKGSRKFSGCVCWEKNFPTWLEARIYPVDGDGIGGNYIWKSIFDQSDSKAEKRMMRRLLEAARFRGLELLKKRYTIYSKTHALRA
jgi:hypothetical protein